MDLATLDRSIEDVDLMMGVLHRAPPERFRMDAYFQDTGCGTAACIAGWCVLDDAMSERLNLPSRALNKSSGLGVVDRAIPALLDVRGVDVNGERLVKSAQRVRDLGEVLTPSSTIQAMLNVLPAELWAPHPSPRFLEPACGDGNFLVAILGRKLARIAKEHAKDKLPAGTTAEAAQFHALEALASIYAVDISIANVVGGTAGHEIGARTRLVTTFSEWSVRALSKRLTERSPVLRAAEWIVEHNVLVGNLLPFDAAGKPTGRDQLPLIDYTFAPSDLSVVIKKTTMGDVLAAEEANTASMFSFVSPAEPDLWKGKALDLGGAARVQAPRLRGPARNGTGRRS